MSEHLIRLRKGWELIDLDSPDLRPAPITLPLPAGWGAARRLRLTRRFGCPPLSLQGESLWLRLESVPGLASLRLNGHDLPLGPYFQGTIDIRLADLLARNELALELSGGCPLGSSTRRPRCLGRNRSSDPVGTRLINPTIGFTALKSYDD